MSSTLTAREQHLRALKLANQHRLARAQLRHRIKHGEVMVTDVILDPPEEARTWDIGAVLMTQLRWGVRRTRHFLVRLQVPERKPLGELTDRQRRMIAKALGAGR